MRTKNGQNESEKHSTALERFRKQAESAYLNLLKDYHQLQRLYEREKQPVTRKDMTAQIFKYKGKGITFMPGQNVMVNATEMSKPFGKEVKQWFDNNQTHEFIHALAKHKGITSKGRIRTSLNASSLSNLYPNLVMVVKGGIPGTVNQGTWMHEDVAIEFARWLSPEFAIWCNDRIKELIRHGITATPQTIEQMISDPDNFIKVMEALKNERNEKEMYRQQAELQKKELTKAAPKVQYHDDVLQSTDIIATNVIAKELGMSAISLNRMLKDMGIIYKCNGVWVLTSKFQNKGYTKTKTFSYIDSSGAERTSISTYWTQKGRKFIHSVMSLNSQVGFS